VCSSDLVSQKTPQTALNSIASASTPSATLPVNNNKTSEATSLAAPETTASIASSDQSSGSAKVAPAAPTVKVARLNAAAKQPATTTQTSPIDPPLPEAIGPINLRRAAATGDATAQFEIAVRYTAGKLIPQNFSKAIYWYQRAAAQNLAPAQYRLGTFYEKGRGVAQDKTTARTWYERAAAKGNLKAIHNLAVIHADGSKGKPDFAKAISAGIASAPLALNASLRPRPRILGDRADVSASPSSPR